MTRIAALAVSKLVEVLGLEQEVVDCLGVGSVDRVFELDDSPDKVYVWKVDMTDRQIVDFSTQLREEFVRKNGHDPEALHFVRNDVVGIESLSPEELRGRVEPWLNNSKD